MMDQETVQRLIAEECDALFEHLSREADQLRQARALEMRDIIAAYSGDDAAEVDDAGEIGIAMTMVGKLVPWWMPTALDLWFIQRTGRRLREMLLAKNKAYGSSALDPVRVFSRAPPEEQILVRLDDKLSRLARGSAAGEDVPRDLLGYLVLLRVSRRVAEAR